MFLSDNRQEHLRSVDQPSASLCSGARSPLLVRVSEFATTAGADQAFFGAIENLTGDDANKVLFGTEEVRDALVQVSLQAITACAAVALYGAITNLAIHEANRCSLATTWCGCSSRMRDRTTRTMSSKILVCGDSGTGKSFVGNGLVGHEAFQSQTEQHRSRVHFVRNLVFGKSEPPCIVCDMPGLLLYKPGKEQAMFQHAICSILPTCG